MEEETFEEAARRLCRVMDERKRNRPTADRAIQISDLTVECPSIRGRMEAGTARGAVDEPSRFRHVSREGTASSKGDE